MSGAERMALGDLTQERVGQDGPKTDEFVYVDISSVDNRLKRIVGSRVLRAEAAPSRAKQNIRAGDVLVSMTRPNLNAVALVPDEIDGAVASTGFHVLRARGVEPRWLYYAVQSPEFVGAMARLVQGALYPAVRPKDVRAHIVQVPEREQQRKSVREIETQFSRLDAAVAALKRARRT